ncbi:MAG: FxsA family protein [Pseudomonadota bacterium]
MLKLLLALAIVPIVEIALLIEVGDAIGTWPTIALVVLTAVVGAALVRHQGIATLQTLRRPEDLAHGAMIAIAGAVLLTPGLVTDAMGFLLLFPAVREAIIARLAARVSVQGMHVSGMGMGPGGGPGSGPGGGPGGWPGAAPMGHAGGHPRGDSRGDPSGHASGHPGGWSGGGAVIEGDFEAVEPERPPQRPGSGAAR